MKLWYYIRRFWEIPGVEKKLFIKCFIISGFYWFLIELIKAKYYIGNFKSGPKFSVNENEIINKVLILKRAIKRIEIVTPWKCTCLNKSIVFKTLSKSLCFDCSISFRVLRLKNGKLIAHSYVQVNDEIKYLFLNQFKNAGLITL